MPPLRLMAVLAHPDDEALGFGGALARYQSEGVETYVVTATLGQKGRYHGTPPGPDHPGAERLAEIREAELRASVDVLGVRELTLLRYMDGALDQVDPREVILRIAAQVRRVRPQVVITFGPDGAYGHPDHVAISQFTTAAIVVAADSRVTDGGPPHSVSKLYYRVVPEAEWNTYQSVFKKLTSLVDGVERTALPWPEWEISTIIDTRASWPVVSRAVSCHDSQVAAYEQLRNLAPDGHEALWGKQHYYRAFSTVNGGRAVEHDLFEGVRD